MSRYEFSALSKLCYHQIPELSCICPYLDFKTSSAIATSIVHSKLEYCNSITTFQTINLTGSNKFITLLLVLLLRLIDPHISLPFSNFSTHLRSTNALNMNFFLLPTKFLQPVNVLYLAILTVWSLFIPLAVPTPHLLSPFLTHQLSPLCTRPVVSAYAAWHQMVPICTEWWCTEANEATQTYCYDPVAPAYPVWAYYAHGRQCRCQEDPVSLPSCRLEKTTGSSPHHVAQHRPTGSETTPPYAPRSSRFGSEPPSVEDDVHLWRYAILELHARNDDADLKIFRPWTAFMVMEPDRTYHGSRFIFYFVFL